MSNLSELEGLDLGSLDDKNKPVLERLKDVASALAIFEALSTADEESARKRAAFDGMFDGMAPYDQDKLKASGQGLKTNLNYNDALRLLDISLSAYIDLQSSLERLVEVRSTNGDRNLDQPKEDIVAEELTHLFRSWPEFHSSYLRLCTQFIKHGVGIAYFDNPTGWKFRVGGLADMLIPRQTPASEDCIDVAVGRREYHLHELNAFVRNPEAAKKVGWDVDEVFRVMKKCVSTSGRSGTMQMLSDTESLQAELKNNDIHTGLRNPTVSVLHFWVKEMDGTISHYMCAEKDPKEFMYKKVSKYEKAEQAYIFFTYGVGTNGTYHSIRGLGQRIFNHVQVINRLRCQQVDGAMLASAVMVQPENSRALDELQFTFYGAYAVISPNVNIIEKAIPNLGTAVQPALQDITQQLQLNTDTVSTYGPQQGSPYRNQMQVVSDADVATRLSGASLNLFYVSWNRLMVEMVRRVVKAPRKDIKEFLDRCAARGVEEEFIRGLDVARTKAVRSIGNGSAANRMVALRELQAISGQFDDVGRRNLTRDIVSTRVGHDLADRYAPITVESRPTVDTKIAILENGHLNKGEPVPVVSSELHGQQLPIHMQSLTQLIEALNSGQADPMQVLPVLQAYYQDIGETVQYAAGDPALQGLVGQANQLLQYAEEAINNTMKALEKLQRDQAGGEAQGGAPQMSDVDMKLQKAQVEMQIAQQKAELDMSLKQRKFEQEQAMRDAREALRYREE